jgi:hypothetical protein
MMGGFPQGGRVKTAKIGDIERHGTGSPQKTQARKTYWTPCKKGRVHFPTTPVVL